MSTDEADSYVVVRQAGKHSNLAIYKNSRLLAERDLADVCNGKLCRVETRELVAVPEVFPDRLFDLAGASGQVEDEAEAPAAPTAPDPAPGPEHEKRLAPEPEPKPVDA